MPVFCLFVVCWLVVGCPLVFCCLLVFWLFVCCLFVCLFVGCRLSVDFLLFMLFVGCLLFAVVCCGCCGWWWRWWFFPKLSKCIFNRFSFPLAQQNTQLAFLPSHGCLVQPKLESEKFPPSKHHRNARKRPSSSCYLH